MIEREEVEIVARLARLELPAGRMDELAGELADIIRYVDRLGELDVSEVEPLIHAAGGHDVYREDVAGPSLPVEDALRNAPDSQDGFFRVPRVIEEVQH